jgi:hypothetical protein
MIEEKTRQRSDSKKQLVMAGCENKNKIKKASS